MREMKRCLILLSCLVGLPTVAHAQATLAGTVRDVSGAVLPGVTVEAARQQQGPPHMVGK